MELKNIIRCVFLIWICWIEVYYFWLLNGFLRQDLAMLRLFIGILCLFSEVGTVKKHLMIYESFRFLTRHEEKFI